MMQVTRREGLRYSFGDVTDLERREYNVPRGRWRQTLGVLAFLQDFRTTKDESEKGMLMARVLFASLSLILGTLFTGCAPAADVINPVVSPSPNIYQSTMADVVTTDASQRAVLIDKKYFGFCAEASPDVTKDTAAALNEAVQITANLTTGVGATGGIEGGLGGGFDREAVATALSKIIFTPSQGIQLYRVGGFNLCQAWINNTITTDMFLDQHGKLLDVVKDLTLAEILVRNPTQTQLSDTQLKDILETIAALQKAVGTGGTGEEEESGGGLENTGGRGSQKQEDVVEPTNAPTQ